MGHVDIVKKMAKYETGKKMYNTLSDSVRNSLISNDINVFKAGAREVFEIGSGSKVQDTDYLDGVLAPYTEGMEQALELFGKDAITGLQ